MSAENVICAKTKDLCPITFLAIVKSTALGSYPAPKFTQLTLNAGSSIVYSKDYDALPVSSLQIEAQPCMYNEVSVSAKHYLLENNQHTKCPRDPITGLNFDPRFYTGSGFTFSEKTYLDENNVLKTLTDKAPGSLKA